ncbi:hypothetical protein [Priestia megaterium]|uniref:hypothetical protein n=1 Tax=Priestia megaterium TaxID=1404 RepID=UPI0011B5F508|nr:hypothetical protein [Priestia megaterium]QDZ88054.1 hypothetical protein D0441_27550 [Priestia megaterium]
MNKNIHTDGKCYGKEKIYPAIVEFMKQKGGEVSHKNISDFIFNGFGIRFGEIHHVIWKLRQNDSRVIKGRPGYSRIVEH